jgi:hypothetical protein
MKIEKYSGSVKPKINLSRNIINLKVGEALRLTTAAETLSSIGRAYNLSYKYNFKIQVKMDGDDVLIIKIK